MRKTCPDDETLVDYVEGRLSEKSRAEVEAHLSACALCFEGLVISHGLMQGRDNAKLKPAPREVTEAAVRLVTKGRAFSPGSLMERLTRSARNLGTIISGSLQIGAWGRLEPIPIRGCKSKASEDMVCMLVPFNGVEAEIEMEKTGNDTANIRVKLQEADRHMKTLRVTLKKGEREVASYVLDEACVAFEGIPFGHYGISLVENGLELGTYVFEIKDTRDGKR